jgi:hypothetical protein
LVGLAFVTVERGSMPRLPELLVIAR